MPLRKAVHAGRFYPANPAELRMSVASDFRQASQVGVAMVSQPEVVKPIYEPAPEQYFPFKPAPSTPWSLSRPLLTLLPHAGHVYCGKVIAATLKNIDLPKRLIILAPKHTQPGHAMAVWPDGAWESPMGRVAVDEALAAELVAEEGGFAHDTKAHAAEHDIEILLPYLQTLRPDLRIVPIAVNRNHTLNLAAQALAAVLKRHQYDGDEAVALILSSDMNHYQDVQENKRLDFMAIDAILRLDAPGLLEVVQKNQISMCGVLPAQIALLACNELKAAHSRLMAYDHSGSAFGDTRRVVGYAGIRIW